MKGTFRNVNIKGISATLPNNCIENKIYYGSFGKKKVDMQIRLTGIKSCRVSGNSGKDTMEEMCYHAANNLLNRIGWSRNEIKAIVLVTQTPSYIMPSTAFILQKRLGIGSDCIVFDINLGCSGYVVGMQTVASLLQSYGEKSKGLLLVGDTLTQYLAEDDVKNKMMFGDACTATAMELGEENIIPFMVKSEGEQYDKIFKKDWKDHFHMDGMAVFQYTINHVVAYLNDFKEMFGILEDDIDCYIFHQAQKYTLDSIADFAKIEQKKILTSYEYYGNTSSASIPLTLCANATALGRKKIKVVMCGFGIGLSFGCVMTELVVDDIISLGERNGQGKVG